MEWLNKGDPFRKSVDTQQCYPTTRSSRRPLQADTHFTRTNAFWSSLHSTSFRIRFDEPNIISRNAIITYAILCTRPLLPIAFVENMSCDMVLISLPCILQFIHHPGVWTISLEEFTPIEWELGNRRRTNLLILMIETLRCSNPMHAQEYESFEREVSLQTEKNCDCGDAPDRITSCKQSKY